MPLINNGVSEKSVPFSSIQHIDVSIKWRHRKRVLIKIRVVISFAKRRKTKRILIEKRF